MKVFCISLFENVNTYKDIWISAECPVSIKYYNYSVIVVFWNNLASNLQIQAKRFHSPDIHVDKISRFNIYFFNCQDLNILFSVLKSYLKKI